LRVLFLLLLLANVLFLAWTQWVVRPPAAAREVTAASQRVQPIRLQRELTAQGTDDATPGALADLQSAACVSVGPFIAPAHADMARSQLERLGFTTRSRVAQDEVRVGYWVRVSDLATAADATNALATLQAAGLGDASVVTEGEPDTVVSVGVYADPRKAAEVAATVQGAGFTPETSDRLRTLEVLWLDIDRQGNGGLPALDALGPPPEGALPYDMRACPGSSDAADVTPTANP
jgi:hypothetical protein